MSTDRINLLDFMKSVDPNGRPAMVAEVLHQTNAMIQDGPTYPSNAPMAERVTIRSALPTVYLSRLDQGITKSKGAVRQQVESIGYIAGRSEVDVRHKKILGEDGYRTYRFNEDMGFLESIAQKHANLALYGDEDSEPLGFTGLAPRLNATASAITGSQVRSMGSVTGSDGASIYICDWGPRGVHFLRPKNHPTGGIEVDNREGIDVDDADGNPFKADVTEFHLMIGLSVKDPRRIARLANIDLSDSLVASPTQGLLTDALIEIINAMPSPMGHTRVCYTDHRIVAALMKQARNNASNVTIQQWQEMPTPHVLGYPVRVNNQASVAESTVS